MITVGNRQFREEKCYQEVNGIEQVQNIMDRFRGRNGSCGELSDGYHTFNELYHHRSMLFASLLLMLPRDDIWKSRQHHDPEFPMYDGMFIAGVDTPFGQATYHMENPYWDIFRVPELERATPFDGHTPEEAIERLYKYALSLAENNM